MVPLRIRVVTSNIKPENDVVTSLQTYHCLKWASDIKNLHEQKSCSSISLLEWTNSYNTSCQQFFIVKHHETNTIVLQLELKSNYTSCISCIAWCIWQKFRNCIKLGYKQYFIVSWQNKNVQLSELICGLWPLPFFVVDILITLSRWEPGNINRGLRQY